SDLTGKVVDSRVALHGEKAVYTWPTPGRKTQVSEIIRGLQGETYSPAHRCAGSCLSEPGSHSKVIHPLPDRRLINPDRPDWWRSLSLCGHLQSMFSVRQAQRENHRIFPRGIGHARRPINVGEH